MSGDGYKGWPEAAPFDKIIVTCSPEKVPQPLVDQLREGGLMVVPVGERYQQTLYLMRKTKGELKSEALRATLFVPMTGEAEAQRKVKPDPTHPQIANGSFEDVNAASKDKEEAAGWHYQRQLTLKSDVDDARTASASSPFTTPSWSRLPRAARLRRRRPRSLGAGTHASGCAATTSASGGAKPTNGRGSWSRSTTIGGPPSARNRSARSPAPSTGGKKRADIRVPLKAREAILRIGLLGAVGELSLDDIRLQVAPPK